VLSPTLWITTCFYPRSNVLLPTQQRAFTHVQGDFIRENQDLARPKHENLKHENLKHYDSLWRTGRAVGEWLSL
jgi:hypothetical protein